MVENNLDINKESDKKQGQDNKVKPKKIGSVSLDELLDMKFEEQLWLVDKLIPAEAITIVSAPANSYKTWTMSHLALAVASGGLFYDHFETTQSGVLIVDEENGDRLLHQQHTMLGAARGLPIRIRTMQNFILGEDSVKWILKECQSFGLKTVIFDSLVDIHRANENDAIEMAQVFKHLHHLKSNGITVLLLHHNRKQGVSSFSSNLELRGSSNIFAAVDANITLTLRGEDMLVVKQPKLRFARRHEAFEVQIVADDDSFSFKYAGALEEKPDRSELVLTVILDLLGKNDPLSTKELDLLLDECGNKVNDKKLKKLLDRLIEEKKIKRVNELGNTKLYSLREEDEQEQEEDE